MTAPTEAALRAAIVAEAESWLGTAYHHMGRVKARDRDRGGVDCAQLVYLVFHAVGICPEMALEPYPIDWHLHRSQERYLGAVLDRAHEVDGAARPGDILLYRWGRLFAHGAIVVAPGAVPMIVHADAAARRVIRARADAGRLGGRVTRTFSIFGG